MNVNDFKLAILVPTYNGNNVWASVLDSISKQQASFFKKIVLDSGSIDNSVPLAKVKEFEILTISSADFNHGLARQILFESGKPADIYIFLTQDCILADNESINNLINAFNDPKVGLAYGRQLPHKNAKVLEAHSRLFNYPDQSIVKTFDDRFKLGIKTASCSNSFAAYRKEALLDVGGFPTQSIFGEDVIVGGKMLITGWKVAYVHTAKAYHSHNYTIIEEFRRYFDIGVFHATNHWLLDNFGKASGEGIKYIKSEFKYVLKSNLFLLPKAFFSNIAKFVGYKLGLNHSKIPTGFKIQISMHKKYWIKNKHGNVS